jgi:hypothetical protein
MIADLVLAVSCWFAVALVLCVFIGRAASRRDRMHDRLAAGPGPNRRDCYDLAR